LYVLSDKLSNSNVAGLYRRPCPIVEEVIMRVFVTGATGFIGSAVVQELISGGHQVIGLARSAAAAKALVTAGAQVHRGDLNDLESVRSGAAQSDGVIHTAFGHDFTRFKANCEIDRAVIHTLGSALEGSARPLIITSGIGILPQGQLLNEASLPASGAAAHPRAASEAAAIAVKACGVRVSTVRLPPTVHGTGDHGFVPMLINTAREQGFAAYAGEGRNRWPAVHRLDAAALYRLVLEKETSGACYHGVAEEGIEFCDIAGAISGGLHLPVRGISQMEAAVYFGWFAHFAAMDVPATSQWTREVLGWWPQQLSLLNDMQRSGYF
jgi:nucleoside-diphosphate-sugar epimerase